MAKKIERTRNTYDETSGGDVVLNTSTYTVLLEPNPNRIGYKITNNTSKDILVNENGKDFTVYKRSLYESEPDNVFTGELTSKSLSGTPTISVVEA